MIIYSGFGFLALVIPMIIAVLLSSMFNFDPFELSFLSVVVILLSAVAVWFAGRKLNSSYGVTSNKRHSFFFIPMEYCSFLIAIIWGVSLFK